MIQDPKTKIEAFDAQQGTVVIRGFSNMGELKGVYGGVVSVESRELTHAATGRKEFGIAIEVKEASDLERQSWSFIDYDEIDPLVKGIDYISKIDASVTRLDNFQADYRTKGDLLNFDFQFIKWREFVFDYERTNWKRQHISQRCRSRKVSWAYHQCQDKARLNQGKLGGLWKSCFEKFGDFTDTGNNS